MMLGLVFVKLQFHPWKRPNICEHHLVLCPDYILGEFPMLRLVLGIQGKERKENAQLSQHKEISTRYILWTIAVMVPHYKDSDGGTITMRIAVQIS